MDASSSILHECLLHCSEPEEKSNVLRLRSRNEWLRGNFFNALNDTLLALRVLGIEVSPCPTQRQSDAMFEEVKNQIMALTWDEILLIPRTKNPKIELAVTLLNDAGECYLRWQYCHNYSRRHECLLEPFAILLRRYNWVDGM